jgi:hypothetical protein
MSTLTALLLGLVLSAPNTDQLVNPLISGTDFEREKDGTFYTGKRFEKELLPATLDKYGHPAIEVRTVKGKITEVVFSAKEKAPKLTQEVLDENKGKGVTRETLESLSNDIQFTLNWSMSPLDAVKQMIKDTGCPKGVYASEDIDKRLFICLHTKDIDVGDNLSLSIGIDIADAKIFNVDLFSTGINVNLNGKLPATGNFDKRLQLCTDKALSVADEVSKKSEHRRFSKWIIEKVINDYRDAFEKSTFVQKGEHKWRAIPGT